MTNKELANKLKKDIFDLGEINEKNKKILDAILFYQDKGGTLNGVAKKFNLSSSSAISRWLSAYKDSGKEGLKDMIARTAKEILKSDTSYDDQLTDMLDKYIGELRGVDPEKLNMLKAVMCYLNGEGTEREISKRWSISKSKMSSLVRKYRSSKNVSIFDKEVSKVKRENPGSEKLAKRQAQKKEDIENNNEKLKAQQREESWEHLIDEGITEPTIEEQKKAESKKEPGETITGKRAPESISSANSENLKIDQGITEPTIEEQKKAKSKYNRNLEKRKKGMKLDPVSDREKLALSLYYKNRKPRASKKEPVETITGKRAPESASNGKPKNLKRQKTNSDLSQGASAFLKPQNSDKKLQVSQRDSTTTTNTVRPSKKPRLGG